MSQVAQAALTPTTQVRPPRRALWAGALLALAAIAAVALVLALDGGSTDTNTAGTGQA